MSSIQGENNINTDINCCHQSDEQNKETHSINISDNNINVSDLICEQEQKIRELEEQLKRSLADYQNFQKRIIQERQKMTDICTEQVLKIILPSLDNFYYGWKSKYEALNSQEKTLKFIDSMEMIFENMLKSLETIGFTVIKAQKGSDFDPDLHEIVLQIDSDEEKNKICEIISPGYQINGKVIKACQVAISKFKS